MDCYRGGEGDFYAERACVPASKLAAAFFSSPPESPLASASSATSATSATHASLIFVELRARRIIVGVWQVCQEYTRIAEILLTHSYQRSHRHSHRHMVIDQEKAVNSVYTCAHEWISQPVPARQPGLTFECNGDCQRRVNCSKSFPACYLRYSPLNEPLGCKTLRRRTI